MKIDSHHHFWRYNVEEYGWLDDTMAVLRRDFLPADLKETLRPLGIDGVVSVQARQSLEETRWLLKLARENSIIKGVVGWVPLADPGISGIMDEFSSERRLVGVRHVVQGEADPAFLERADFNRGIRTLAYRNLVYDILIFARQLEATIAFVDRYPGQAFVLDHIAKPVVDGTPSAAWRKQIAELARRQNVTCKFSGVVTEAPGLKWTPSQVEPYFDVVLNAFGPRRLMFGSDWPVCLAACAYTQWHDCVRSCAVKLSPAEQARIFGGTAIDVYRLVS